MPVTRKQEEIKKNLLFFEWRAQYITKYIHYITKTTWFKEKFRNPG